MDGSGDVSRDGLVREALLPVCGMEWLGSARLGSCHHWLLTYRIAVADCRGTVISRLATEVREKKLSRSD